jgi:hypothetical protein
MKLRRDPVQKLHKGIARCRPRQKFFVRFPNSSVLRIGKQALRKEEETRRFDRQGVLSLRGALERSLASGKVVCVVVPDIVTAIRQLRRMWAGKVDFSSIEGAADVWGWSRDTPKNELDFRLILRGANALDSIATKEIDG